MTGAVCHRSLAADISIRSRTGFAVNKVTLRIFLSTKVVPCQPVLRPATEGPATGHLDPGFLGFPGS